MNSKKKENLFYLGLYTLVFAAMCLIVFQQFWSAGKSLVWGIDGWTQHYKALQFYSDWLQGIAKNLLENHRLIIPLWSECIGYGSDIITTLHYYVIGDPLCLLSVFVPDRYMINFYDALIILRLYLAGLSLYAFCRYRNKREERETGWKNWLINSTGMLAAVFVYLFSGYVFVMGLHHPYFLNPMIYLPLMLIGVEKILEKKSPALFIAMVCISAVSNFYYFYMIGCNVIVYVLVRLFTKYGVHDFKTIVCKLLQTAGYTLTGICLSGIMLFPVLKLLMQTERMSEQSGIQLLYNSDFYTNLPAAFFSALTVPGMHHTFMAFSMPAVFCLILLFMDKKKKRELKTLFIVLTLVMCLPLAGKIFHGFAYSSNRWMFGYAMLMACITASEWNNLFHAGWKKLIGMAVLIAAVIGYLIRWQNGSADIVISVAAIFMSCILVLLFIFQMLGRRKIWLQSLVLFAVIVVSVGTNAFYNFSKNGYNGSADFMEKENVKAFFDAPADTALRTVLGNDPVLARYSGSFDAIERNSTLKSGFMSTHYYWSLADKRPAQFFEEMGINNKNDYNYRNLDDRTVLNSLASVKYYVVRSSEEGNVPYGYKKLGESNVNTEYGAETYEVYENMFALPLGYTYDGYISRSDYEKLNSQEKESAILHSVLLENDLPDYKKQTSSSGSEEIGWEIKEQKDVTFDGNTFHVRKKHGHITLQLKNQIANSETAVLIKKLSFSSKTMPRKQVEIKIEAESAGKPVVKKNLLYLMPGFARFIGRSDFLINLGYSENGTDKITIYFPRQGNYKVNDFQILGQTMDGYEEGIRERKENVLENIQLGTNRITGQINLEKDKILCLTIPYSEGWTARVDGKETEILQANTMFMAIPLEKGSHSVVLTYRTPGMMIGIVMTAMGAGLCVIIAAKRRYNKKKML